MSISMAAASSRTFVSLRRHRNYRLYFGGQVVSLSGTWVQNVAQAWFIVELSHSSPLAVGILAACQFGPFAVGGLFGGALADRLDSRTTLLFTQSAMACTAMALAILALTHSAQEWEVYLIAAATGSILILDTPVRQMFTIQMVGRDELPNAIALNSSLFNASRIVGPAIGGALIASTGVGLCFLINSLSFLAAIVALWLMRPEDLYALKRDGVRQNIVRDIIEGVIYSWRNATVRLVILMMLFIATIAMNFNVIMPILTANTLHAPATVFGALSAAFGGGALIGALYSASLSHANFRTLATGALLFGAAEMVLAPQRTVWAAALLLVLTGFAFSLYTSQSNSTLQLIIPDRVRGRVLAIYAYVFFGTAPLGGLLTGWISDRIDSGAYFLIAGGVSILTALAGIAAWQAGPPSRSGRRRETLASPAALVARE